jgi:Fe2+ or Zn2+ uptake regulation protein
MAQDNTQAVNEYLDSVCLHLARTLDGHGNLVCESCGKVEPETDQEIEDRYAREHNQMVGFGGADYDEWANRG